MDPIATVDVREVTFDETVDVVVVGLGVAGSSAVLGAVEAGADVVAIERAAGGGGTSALSGGLIYLGGGTELQRACGFTDTPGNMAAFLRAALGPGVDENRLTAYCEGSAGHFDWLVRNGVPFKAKFCEEPNRESADDAGLLFSGGEDSYPFDEVATPVPRGHKPQWTDSAGGFLMERLGAAVDTSGARVLTDAGARSLVVDDGEVVGVVVTGDGGDRTVRARGGVVLAMGGFIHNDAMVAEFCPAAHQPNPAWRIGTPNDDGRGIRLGVGAGAAIVRMETFECALPLGPPHRMARGILVNQRGERFINEDTYTGRIGLCALTEQDGQVFMITDDVIHERNPIGLRIGFAAEGPDELARDLGLPAETFARTVGEYNAAAARGEDPRFHKRPPFLQPIGVPPASGIGAVDLRVDRDAIYATFTLGGLATDVDAAACREDGTSVAGLYAVGRTAASLAAHNYASGISLGDGSFFGRRAGHHAARRAKGA